MKHIQSADVRDDSSYSLWGTVCFHRVGPRPVAMTGRGLFLCACPFRGLYKNRLFISLTPALSRWEREPRTSAFDILFGVRYWVFPALALFGLLHLEQVIPNEADIPASRWPRENHRHVFFTFPCIGGNLQRAANTRARCAGQSCQVNLPDAYSRGPDLQRRQRRLCIAV